MMAVQLKQQQVVHNAAARLLAIVPARGPSKRSHITPVLMRPWSCGADYHAWEDIEICVCVLVFLFKRKRECVCVCAYEAT